VKLTRGPLAEGRVVLSLKIGQAGSGFWQQWIFTYPNVPEGKEEAEVAFMFPLPPDGNVNDVDNQTNFSPDELSEGKQ